MRPTGSLPSWPLPTPPTPEILPPQPPVLQHALPSGTHQLRQQSHTTLQMCMLFKLVWYGSIKFRLKLKFIFFSHLTTYSLKVILIKCIKFSFRIISQNLKNTVVFILSPGNRKQAKCLGQSHTILPTTFSPTCLFFCVWVFWDGSSDSSTSLSRRRATPEELMMKPKLNYSGDAKQLAQIHPLCCAVTVTFVPLEARRITTLFSNRVELDVISSGGFIFQFWSQSYHPGQLDIIFLTSCLLTIWWY